MAEMRTTIPGSRAAASADLMPALVKVLYAIAPIQFLMLYIGTDITWGMILATFIGTAALVALLRSQTGLRSDEERPIIYAVIFLSVCLIGIILSPYRAESMGKGLINLFAMLAMLGAALVVIRQSEASYGFFRSLIRISAIATGLAGLTIIIQFILGDVLNAPKLFDLSGLARALSGGSDWWNATFDHGVLRPNGIYQEPSFISAYVGITAGLALARLGAIGREPNAVSEAVPLWAAVSILLSLLLSMSGVCYAALFVTVIAVTVSRKKFGIQSLVVLILVATVTLGALAIVVVQAAGGIADRIAGLVVFTNLGQLDPAVLDSTSTQYTVMITFLNAEVAYHNLVTHPVLGVGLGGHASAYFHLLSPRNFGHSIQGFGYNSTDANALSLRLISETGLVGTFIFVAIFASAWLRTRRAILRLMANRHDAESRGFAGLAAGLNGGLAGVFAAYLIHVPHYYDAQFWGLFALCVAIPPLAKHFFAQPGTPSASELPITI